MVGAKNINFKIFTRKHQIICDEFAMLEFIPPKYKKYKNIFEKFEKRNLLPKHFENDHEIVLEITEKLITGFIYNINE